jgi:hypothetical protein
MPTPIGHVFSVAWPRGGWWRGDRQRLGRCGRARHGGRTHEIPERRCLVRSGPRPTSTCCSARTAPTLTASVPSHAPLWPRCSGRAAGTPALQPHAQPRSPAMRCSTGSGAIRRPRLASWPCGRSRASSTSLPSFSSWPSRDDGGCSGSTGGTWWPHCGSWSFSHPSWPSSELFARVPGACPDRRPTRARHGRPGASSCSGSGMKRAVRPLVAAAISSSGNFGVRSAKRRPLASW